MAELGGDRLSEDLALGLRQSVVSFESDRYVLDLLTSNPTAAGFARSELWRSVDICGAARVE